MINFKVENRVAEGTISGDLREITLDVGTLIATIYDKIKEEDDQAACIFASALISGTEKLVQEDAG